ncbi:ABC transporter ATP-binding protein [Paenibacillus sp. MMS18-CY102]|uniref:ABC transporter ATP-binding protein n=1 Tax=Paenibacillus sp. MMS18-CY102 TaxID=2682849 RepID=UPI0013663F40|nr:ABC transporter ATP-binding protein [Paenibacillus sp. MMS18-CY102]MWC27639.1 ATP-binding cassette domain-containing protein [Paenibacillus sp. MMS18-CY102]
MKWLLTFMMPRKWFLLLSIGVMALESICGIQAVALQQKFIDSVIINQQYGLFWPTLGWISAAFLLHALLFTLGPHTTHLNMAYFHKRLAGQFMKTIYRLPMSKLRKERSGSYVQFFSNDIENVYGLLGSDIARGMQQLIAAVLLIAIVAKANMMMLVALFLFIVVYIGMGKYFSSRMKKAARAVQENRSALVVQLEESISGTREVIAFHREEWERTQYKNVFQRYYESIMNEGKWLNKQMLATDPFKWAMKLLVIVYGGYLVINHSLSIGMFVVVFQLTSMLGDTCQSLFNTVMGLSGRMASVERVREALEENMFDPGSEPLEGKVSSLRFQQVGFTYESEEQQVLHEVTLDMPMGKKIAFVGASGSGKSTVAHLLSRFFEPGSGEIVVNGMDLKDIRRDAWTEHIGIVFQDPYIFPDSIANNIKLGLDATEEQITKVCQAVEIDEHIRSLPLQYETPLGERGMTLSGGQRQRIALARALLRDPEILILDEATSALDLETERTFQRNLDTLREGKTTIIIAHRLSTIENADVIYVMQKGRIVDAGTHEELMSESRAYHSLLAAHAELQVS